MYIGLRGLNVGFTRFCIKRLRCLSVRFWGVGFRLLQLPPGITTTCPEASDDTQESGDI